MAVSELRRVGARADHDPVRGVPGGGGVVMARVVAAWLLVGAGVLLIGASGAMWARGAGAVLALAGLLVGRRKAKR